PVAQGGRKDWENIVTCCVTCNRRKGGRTPAEAGMHLLRMPKRPESARAIRITVGLLNAPDSWRDYLYWNVELDDTSRQRPNEVSSPTITGIQPSWTIEGGWIVIQGEGFAIDGPFLPEVRIGDSRARIVCASSTELSAIVPSGLEGGRATVRVAGAPGETAFV